ncbi:hypothetical protein PMKS-003066 [Pichia membranifaciens]|uniref:Uncharacterized protein n=1 Tax=Pichia membranifaciens TaxID=4926 RepID=A0A1Q2YJ67_9ASCO|nr:hypothetical protein PMKS-003066 [Pichia membranifaciens]
MDDELLNTVNMSLSDIPYLVGFVSTLTISSMILFSFLRNPVLDTVLSSGATGGAAAATGEEAVAIGIAEAKENAKNAKPLLLRLTAIFSGPLAHLHICLLFIASMSEKVGGTIPRPNC